MKIIHKNKTISILVICAVLTGATLTIIKENNNSAYAYDALCISQRCKDAADAEEVARKKADDAAAEKGTYQGEVNKIAAEIAQIQANIQKNDEEIAILDERIKINEEKLISLKDLLSKNMTQAYLDDQISALEILASSNSLDDYTEKQTARSTVSQRTQSIATDLRNTKTELEHQRVEVQTKRENNITAQNEAARRQAEQQAMVNEWAGRETEFAVKAKENQKIKEDERAAQAAANAAAAAANGGSGLTAGDPGHGGYPAYLDNAAMDSRVDPWGMYNRECVSYAAWKVDSTYGNMPYWGGRGNAWQWLGNARAAGIPVSSTPKPGSVGIATWGIYGHAVWVEAVSGSQVYVSQYNWDSNGHYSEMWINAGTYTYIYFGDWRR